MIDSQSHKEEKMKLIEEAKKDNRIRIEQEKSNFKFQINAQWIRIIDSWKRQQSILKKQNAPDLK